MIASIHGNIISIGETSLVVEVGGLGLQVFVPTGVCNGVQINDSIFLHTYLVVRQDAMVLYGFEREDERQFFLLLLGVSGIGPRTAMAILSTLSLDVIRSAVINEQPDVFARVSGVSRKTGQKILVYLQDKVGKEAPLAALSALDADNEVIEALTSLGYSVIEAQAALQSLPKDTPQDVETRLRLALQTFNGR